MTAPQNLQILTPLPMSRYALNVCPHCNRTSLTATTPFSANRKDFLLFNAHFARKYTQCWFTWYTSVFNKQFWQQNLVTSMFLVKCLLLTASFLSSRKQYESFNLKHHRHFHQLLQRWGSTNHHMVVTFLVKHTFPPPALWNI